jgi:sugar phosphate isomerase/epimerase
VSGVPRDRSALCARLSCADSTFPRLSHDAALAVIRDLSIGAVDVCVFPGSHTEPDVVLRDPTRAAEVVADRARSAGLAVADVFLILGFEELAVNHPDKAVRERSLEYFVAAVSFARRLGVGGLSILPGMPFVGVEPDTNLARAVVELERRAQLAGEVGLAVSVEPHYESIAQTPLEALALLERAPSISLTLDYSHFAYQGIDQANVDVLIPRTRHVHLRQAATGSMQLPAAEGAINFPQLLAELAAGGYGGYMCLEYQWEEWLDCRRVDCISETAELRDIVLGARPTAAGAGVKR